MSNCNLTVVCQDIENDLEGGGGGEIRGEGSCTAHDGKIA